MRETPIGPARDVGLREVRRDGRACGRSIRRRGMMGMRERARR
jgi:hypothetical protein